MENVLVLEERLGFKLVAAKSYIELIQIFNNKSYVLDNTGEIIGLHLYDCNISDLSFLKNLRKIKYLLLGKNRIKSINFLFDKVCLTSLDLSENEIHNITPLTQLVNISFLNLQFNEIESIDALSNLTNIINLDLRGNLITDIYPLLDLIKKGLSVTTSGNRYRSINIMENNIDPILLSIIDKGREAIIRHLERIDEEGMDYIHEAKLTLVGDGSSGKTSLQVKLLDHNAELPNTDSRTRGIEIHDWYFKEKDKKYIAHIWDFGGQDVYYPVHRFFITENSVFVLLASTRQPHHNFDYWIPTIFQFGGESPIILVQTCFDGNKKNWTDINHYLTYPGIRIVKTQVKPYYELNLPLKNLGLLELQNVIIGQIENLKYFGKKVPKSWVLIRKAIAAHAETASCISFETFVEICNSKGSGKKLSLVDVEDIADFFHALGTILWYRNVNELKGWIILKPEWAMNAVYKIIDDIDIQVQMGNISFSDFERIWHEPTYDHKHDILVKMLEVFRIAFPKKNKRNEFIIPARLDSMPNINPFKDIDGNFLAIQYEFSFMPKGLVNQISADLSRLILSDSAIWNDGVIFQDEEKFSKAIVIENLSEKKIYLKAMGQEPRSLLKIIMNSIDNIVDGYRGVRPNIMIPCSCAICRASDKPFVIPYKKLLDWLDKKDKIRCNESDSDIYISDLLFRAGLSETRVEKLKDEVEQSPLRSFISYSKYDGEECEKRDGINYLEMFKETISPLIKHSCLIQTWDDTQLIAGEYWDERIKDELQRADIIFLLISNSFLNTNYIINTELKIAFEREDRGECIVIPIVIKESGWYDIEWISKRNAIPRKGKNISSWRDDFPSVDSVWNGVYVEVKKAIESFIENRAVVFKQRSRYR
jgi:internalin A